MSTTPAQTTVPLSQPIKRGEQEITAIDLRKPASGELRGLKLVDVLHMDVNSLGVLLPRISQPTITKADVDAMDMADLLDLGVAVVGFFESPAPTKP